MSGIKPFYKLDSVIIYEYAPDWKLKKVNIIKEDHSFHQYSQDEIEVSKEFLHLEGKANSLQKIELKISNRTPQNYKFNFISNKEILKVPTSEKLLLNRSEMISNIEVKIEHGINEFELLIKNSNEESKQIKIETIGYDLMENDFKAPVDKSSKKKNCITKTKRIFH